MVVTCEVEFDQNSSGTYFSGQLVNGVVTLKADKPKDVKGVLLKIYGYSHTQWREKHFNKRRTYSGREDYMSSLTYLMGSQEAQKNTIPAGTRVYTFSCQLPYNCPTSFEGLYGCIRYVVKVILIRPWKFDQTYSRGFTVLRMMDLNCESPQLRLPSNTEGYKTFCCGPCKTEPLKLQLSVPQGGFVPGQMIPVTALVINNTNIPVSEVNFALVMLVRYFSQTPVQHSRVETTTVSRVKGEGVLRNCTRSIMQELQVPATPPTCMSLCSIIKIIYQIEVVAKMSGIHSNQVSFLPITIGTVPLWNAVIQQQPTSSNYRAVTDQTAKGEYMEKGDEQEKNMELPMVNALTSSGSSGMLSDLYANMPPPSYEESVHTVRGDINEDELHALEACEFAPLYPVYKFAAMANNNNNDNNFNPAVPDTQMAYVNESYIS